MPNGYPKGSEWRKWDLHVHSPASAFNNQFEGSNNEEKWNKYLKKLSSLSDISVLGITDYFSIEGYKKVRGYKNQGHLNNIDLILPDVELRILPVTSDDTPINLHIIFSPEIVDELNSRFFSSLEFHYQNQNFKCIQDDLVKLGKKYKHDDSTVSEDTAYQSGLEQFKTSIDKLKEMFSKDKGLRDNSLIIVSNKSTDGASGIQSSSLTATREEIYRFADCIFSANPSDRDYFLGEGTDNYDEVIRKYDRLKPCIHGSDAHSLEKICHPDHSRFCWIKADPTFEGLKQILYEPEERVYIGSEPPTKLDKQKVIKSITISHSNNWFENNKCIEFNEGLICIVGGKGTGKTALLDLIAYTLESYKEDEKSFLKKAINELKGTKIRIEMEEGSPVEKELKEKLEISENKDKIRYLPQDFVENLCSEIGKESLEKQIEDVIFQKIPKGDRIGYIDFSSYKNKQLDIIKQKKERTKEQLQKINLKIHDLTEFILLNNKINEEIKKTNNEIVELNKKMLEISKAIKDSTGKQGLLEQINLLNEQESKLGKEISNFSDTLSQIEQIKYKVAQFKDYKEEFKEEIKEELKSVKLFKEIVEQVKIILYPEDLEDIILKKEQNIKKEKEEKGKQLKEINDKIIILQKDLKLEKSKQDKIQEVSALLNKAKQKIDSLNKELGKVKEAENNLPTFYENRKKIFIEFFNLLFKEKKKLEDIYLPLVKELQESTEENERLFNFSIQFNFDTKSMADRGGSLIDHGNKGRFYRRTIESLYGELEHLKFPLNIENEDLSNPNKEIIWKFINDIEALFLKDEKGIDYKISTQLKEGYTEKDFYDWLYGMDYYSISYSIKFNGIELDNLSPGLKGVALLILFLELDKEDKRPILIDQPEENLDNRSIYQTLMRYFRDAKKRRQVIIVTHNPNLVVNTDSEQIIVANFDRSLGKQVSKISYVQGSLENTFKDDSTNSILEKQGIREHVCEILEGGKEAFEKREHKYGFRY